MYSRGLGQGSGDHSAHSRQTILQAGPVMGSHNRRDRSRPGSYRDGENESRSEGSSGDVVAVTGNLGRGYGGRGTNHNRRDWSRASSHGGGENENRSESSSSGIIPVNENMGRGYGGRGNSHTRRDWSRPSPHRVGEDESRSESSSGGVIPVNENMGRGYGGRGNSHTRRDWSRPSPHRDGEDESRSESNSGGVTAVNESAGRGYGSGRENGGRGGTRDHFRGNRKGDGSRSDQGHRRDDQQNLGRKEAGTQAASGGVLWRAKESPLPQVDNGEALWRAKRSQVPQLVQELEEKLTRGSIECMICYDMVGRNSPVWSCDSCYAIFHLSCIKKWARAPTSTDLSISSANHSLEGNWRCPGCQAVELIIAKDLRYTCYCGQVDNPPVDHYLTPHSCGGPCKKPLDRNKIKRCHHHCTMQCHPGPCPPCSAVAPSEFCPCGQKTFTRRCGEQKAITSCGEVCGRDLLCGRHSCPLICHEGSCRPCKVEVNTQCFCGKKHETIACGAVEIQGGIDFEKGILSCGARCSKQLSCGNHNCQEKCHPGPCGQCDLSPALLQTCPCGKKSLQDLLGAGRQRVDCTDPIPTCGEGCSKILPCNVHACKDLCHSGPCSPCRVPVVQKCRCGSSSRSVACHVARTGSFEGEESAGLFLCEKKCGKKMSCGRHRCNNRCCPSSFAGAALLEDSDRDPHDCMLVCGKKLRCRQHNCEERCHSGHCPPCLESIFTELSCACGKTSIPPPVPCGTPLPACQEPCSFTQPCGHQATHLCHFGDCPPCTIPVTKECVGNHVLLRGVPCGSRDIKCNKLCGKTRQCGLHACGRACHVPPCDNMEEASVSSGRIVKRSCGQPCGAPRRDCSHTCVSSCHPAARCPDNRCKVVVTITCGCGRVSGDVPCDAGGSSTSRASAETEMVLSRLPTPLQPLNQGSERTPLGQRKLCCDDECAKLEKRRLLADAFGVDMAADGGKAGPLGSELVTEMLRRDPQWLLAVEERFRSLLLGPKATGMKVHVFRSMPKERREVIYQLAERWGLSVSSAGREPSRFPIVHVTTKSKVPYTRLLSKTPVPPAGKQTPPAFNAAVDMEPRLVVAFFDVPREVDMSGLVLRFAGECELVWLNDKNALAIFGDAARSATALRRVDHTTAYKGAIAVPGSAVYASGKGAWGQESGPSFASAAKPAAKKKGVQESSSSWVEDAWGEERRKSSQEQLIGAWQKEEPPITTRNPWGALQPGGASVMINDPRPRGSQPQTSSTKEGESSTQGQRTRLTQTEKEDASGSSNEITPVLGNREATASGPQVNEEDDWERLLD